MTSEAPPRLSRGGAFLRKRGARPNGRAPRFRSGIALFFAFQDLHDGALGEEGIQPARDALPAFKRPDDERFKRFLGKEGREGHKLSALDAAALGKFFERLLRQERGERREFPVVRFGELYERVKVLFREEGRERDELGDGIALSPQPFDEFAQTRRPLSFLFSPDFSAPRM